jgi:hypothetical protein
MTSNELKASPKSVQWKSYTGKFGFTKVVGYYETVKSVRFQLHTDRGSTTMNCDQLAEDMAGNI